MNEYKTFKAMRQQVQRQIGDSSSNTSTKIDDWLNNHYSSIARKKLWPQLIKTSEEVVSLVAGVPYLYLPKEVETLHFVMEQNLGASVNMAIDALLRGAGPDFRTAGIVSQWADAGECGRRTEFYTSAEMITVSHTASTSITAVIHGVTTAAAPGISAQERSEEVTVPSASSVTSSLTYADLVAVSTEDLTSDLVTVTGTTSGTTYATIGPGEQTARYKRIRLLQVPQLSDPITVVWKKRIAKLIFDHQSIEIPVGQQIVDATVATMLVRQREYNSAAIYHEQRAASGVEDVFSASNQQGEQVLQARPYGRDPTRRIIVINPN